MNIFEMPEMSVLELYAEEVMGPEMEGGSGGDFGEDL